MNIFTQAVKVGLFFIFGLAMIWVVHETLDDTGFYQAPHYTIEASFEDLKQLKVSDEVRLAGVKIGMVHATRLQGKHAIAVLNIEQTHKIPKDSKAVIAMAGLLGANYVGIKPGANKTTFEDGDSINTEESADLTSVFNQVGSIASKVDSFLGGSNAGENSMGSLFENLNTVVCENRTKVANILTNLETASAKIASGKGTIGKLVQDDEVYENLSTMIKDIKSIASSIEKGEGTFGALLTDKKMAQEVRDTITNVKEFSAKLNSDDSTLGHLISSDDLYQRANATLNRVDNAVSGIENTGPVTAVGVAAAALF